MSSEIGKDSKLIRFPNEKPVDEPVLSEVFEEEDETYEVDIAWTISPSDK